MAEELRKIAAKKEIKYRTDKRPFVLQWLDSAYQETALYNTAWDTVKKKICDGLAEKIEKQRDEPERMQMIFEIVGPEFKKTYFPDLTYEPFLLQPPNLNREQVGKLRGEATAWLSNQAQRVAKDTGCGRVPPGTQPGQDLCDEQLEFLQTTYEIFLQNQDRYMVQKELEERERQRKEEEKKLQEEKENAEKNKVEVKYRSASTLSSVPSSAMTIRKETTLDEKIEKMVGKEPIFHTFQTETVALSVKKILQRDPKRFVDVAQRLHGRQLGVTLRIYMWLDVLFKADRDRLREGDVEKMVRERFGRAVARGVVDLSLKRPTHCPIAGLIENAVVETYAKTLAMRPYNSDQHLIDASRALNVLYTFDRSYEPYLVHWLFPIQVAFKEHSGSIEHIYELAMYLDLVNQNCYPSWPKIFSMADQTLLRLEQCDREFYNHLKTICLKEVKVNPKEFMIYLIHEERGKAQELLNLPPSSAESSQMSRELLADPLIFLRKWIGEGFVSVLDTPAVLFVWDQNFMQFWAGKTIENTCLTLLELLRYKFMEAQNYTEMKNVFLSAPCKLYTADIQRGWIHIERGGNPAEVQFFNRQRPIPKPREPTQEREEEVKTPLVFVEEGPLPMFGIKNLGVKLVVPSELFYREAWLAQFDPENIKMMATLYFGGKKLDAKLSMSTPEVRITTQAEGQDRIMYVNYVVDTLLFDHDSLKEIYTVLEDTRPFIAFRVDYLQITGKVIAPLPLGWAIVSTHDKTLKPKPKPPPPKPAAPSPGKKGKGKGKKVVSPPPKEPEPELPDEYIWTVTSRRVELQLIPGLMPQCVLEVPPQPPVKKPPLSVLTEGSVIQSTIFDPLEKSPTGTPEQIVSALKSPTPVSSIIGTPPRPGTGHWLRHDPDASLDDTKFALDVTEPFDLYIDSLRFLPDTATIVKITGRFLKTGEVTNLPDIEAFPEVHSEPRNAEFNFRMVVNDSRHKLNEGALLILRVYTVQKFDRALVVVGSCLLNICKDGKLNLGGFQLRLRNGMPDVSQGVANLQSNAMDNITPIPSSSILIRLLPHEPGYRPIPDYQSGYYQSDDSHPNQSEKNIFKSYSTDSHAPKHFIKVIEKIKREESDESETTDLHVVPYIAVRTDPKRYLPPQTPAGNLDILQAVQYRIESGFRAQIQAFGLPEGFWWQCVVKVVRGPRDLNHRHKRADNFGVEDKALTTNLDYTSSQKAPKWNDNLDFHCYFDPQNFLLIQIFGVKFQYRRNDTKKIVSTSGKPLTENDLTTAWAAVPLFLNESLKTGVHIVPAFKDLPTVTNLQNLTDDILKAKSLTKYQTAGFRVKLLDLQFHCEEEFPVQPIPTYKDLLPGEAAGYERAVNDDGGKYVNDLVLRALPPDLAKAGAHGDTFQREQLNFDQAAVAQMLELMKAKNCYP